MDGGSLAERLAAAPGGRLAVDGVLRTGRTLADALAHAHAHGVVHRDVKPDNIWLAGDGTAGLGDFGIAVAPATVEAAAAGHRHAVLPARPSRRRARRRCRRPTSTRSARRCGSCLRAARRSTGPDAAALLAQHRSRRAGAAVAPRAGVPPALDALLLGAARQAGGGPARERGRRARRARPAGRRAERARGRRRLRPRAAGRPRRRARPPARRARGGGGGRRAGGRRRR